MTLDIWLLLGAAIVIAAIASVRLAHRTGLPSLLIFLGFGLLLGPSGVGIPFENPQLAQQIGLSALAVILAEGGLTTNWSQVRRSVPLALVLATAGVTVSIVVVALVVQGLLGIDGSTALILGAVLASTDAAAVFSVLRRLPLPPRLAGVLEAESGFNDAPTVIAVVLLSSSSHSQATLGTFLLETSVELVIGAAVGLAVGPAGAYALRRVALPASGLYPIAVLALTFVSYGGAVLLHGSGFLAVYLTALILGNSRLPHRAATRGFAEGAAWLAQIGLFVMLGMLANVHEMPSTVIPALIIGTVLVLLARPLSVLVSSILGWFLRLGWVSWREQAFLSWAGLRGAVPRRARRTPTSLPSGRSRRPASPTGLKRRPAKPVMPVPATVRPAVAGLRRGCPTSVPGAGRVPDAGRASPSTRRPARLRPVPTCGRPPVRTPGPTVGPRRGLTLRRRRGRLPRRRWCRIVRSPRPAVVPFMSVVPKGSTSRRPSRPRRLPSRSTGPLVSPLRRAVMGSPRLPCGPRSGPSFSLWSGPWWRPLTGRPHRPPTSLCPLLRPLPRSWCPVRPMSGSPPPTRRWSPMP
ncbi:potassium/proton antiporter [Nonomuraea sp. NPDC004297]